MRQILTLTETMPWRDALKAVAAEKPVHTHLTSGIGADFIYNLPWHAIRRVLDIGAGMGFLSIPMSQFAEDVVALEAVPERALFMARRAAQDQVSNVHPIIASATDLPFPPESFDLITLNGVFEYIGLWGDADPEDMQLAFLKRALTLLRPDGYLYIGIETRFGLGNWFGARDHSGLKYTSLMPRRLADWYCRWRQKPYFGSETIPQGYRTYTHTAGRYRRLLLEAGFAAVEVHGCFPGYNEQRAIYPLESCEVRRCLRDIVDRPRSRLGALRRIVTDARPTYRIFEGEVLLLACKGGGRRPLTPASGASSQSSSGQLNTYDKILLIEFVNERPIAIAKAGKDSMSQQRLATEFEFTSMVTRLREKVHLEIRLPKPHAQRVKNGVTFYEYEYVAGDSLSNILHSRTFRLGRFAELLPCLVDGYLDLCSWLQRTVPRMGMESQEGFLDGLSRACIADEAAKQEVNDACALLLKEQWPLSWVHGDLCLSNAMVSNGQLVLIDWENVSSQGLVAVDLIRLLYDVWLESARLRRDLRDKAMQVTGHATRRGLEKLGFSRENHRHVGALFVALQCSFVSDRGGKTDKLVRDYRRSVMSILPGN